MNWTGGQKGWQDSGKPYQRKLETAPLAPLSRATGRAELTAHFRTANVQLGILVTNDGLNRLNGASGSRTWGPDDRRRKGAHA
jgi:hypothetical protein